MRGWVGQCMTPAGHQQTLCAPACAANHCECNCSADVCGCRVVRNVKQTTARDTNFVPHVRLTSDFFYEAVHDTCWTAELAALCAASKNSGSFGFVKAAQQPFGAASSLSTAWAHGTLCGEDPKPFRLSETLEAARPERDSSAGVHRQCCCSYLKHSAAKDLLCTSSSHWVAEFISL